MGANLPRNPTITLKVKNKKSEMRENFDFGSFAKQKYMYELVIKINSGRNELGKVVSETRRKNRYRFSGEGGTHLLGEREIIHDSVVQRIYEPEGMILVVLYKKNEHFLFFSDSDLLP